MSTLRAQLAALALLTLAPAAVPQDCEGDPGFRIDIGPMVEIGSNFTTCLTTPPGDWMVFLLPGFNQGSTSIKAGTLCIAPPFLTVYAFPLPPSGQLCFPHAVPCDPTLIGFTGYFQFVAASMTQPGVFGISNLGSLTTTDGPCNHPCTGTMGDFVFVDTDNDGVQGPHDVGIPGVTLLLRDQLGEVIGTATTDASGQYLFSDLCAGLYSVEVDASTVPEGYLPVPCDVGGDDALDSDCSPLTVVLPADDSHDLDSDFGFSNRPEVPGLELAKSVSPAVAAPFEPVTYTYTVTNTGGTTLTGIVVTDDNGTPGYAADDFTVGTVASLAPGDEAVLTAELIPPVCMVGEVGGETVEAGSVIVVDPQNGGDIRVTYLQDFGINDNTYGANDIGWPGNNHKFTHLTGSDMIEFRFFNGAGSKVLDFDMDYCTKTAGFPSGYGSLGATGGDGEMHFGSAAHLVSWTSSLAENLNHPANLAKLATLTENSPTALVDGSVVIDAAAAPGGWDPINSYTVVLKAAAFGASGFGSVAVPEQHNSPSKTGQESMSAEPTDCTVVNTATAVTAVAGGTLSATAKASVQIVTGAECELEVTRTSFDRKDVKVTIANDGDADVVLSGLTLNWPTSNGKLKQIKLDGDVIYDTPDLAAPSATLTAAQLVSDLSKRTIKKGTSDDLVLVFEKDAKTSLWSYDDCVVSFGDCSLPIL